MIISNVMQNGVQISSFMKIRKSHSSRREIKLSDHLQHLGGHYHLKMNNLVTSTERRGWVDD